MPILAIGIFLGVLAAVLLAIGFGMRFLEAQSKKQVSNVLKAVTGMEDMPQTRVLVEQAHEGPSSLTEFLARFDFTQKVQAQLQQSGLNWTLTQLLGGMVVAGVVGTLLGLRLRVLLFTGLSMLALGCFFALLPYLYVLFARKKRLGQFEEQFPEALDFLARAMRAGHAFTVGLEMLSQETPEPLRSEFRKVYNEQNLGAPLPGALEHLAVRVPSVDVRFFVSAVLMQRESGGNLGEILTKLAYVIRERFRLKGQVRAASAHGRITATILTILPIVTVLALSFVAPGYLPAMAHDPQGRYMIVGAILGQIVGYLVMRKIINIKV